MPRWQHFPQRTRPAEPSSPKLAHVQEWEAAPEMEEQAQEVEETVDVLEEARMARRERLWLQHAGIRRDEAFKMAEALLGDEQQHEEDIFTEPMEEDLAPRAQPQSAMQKRISRGRFNF